LPDIDKTLSEVIEAAIPVFTVVRDPVARFWSACQDKIVQNPGSRIAEEVAAFYKQAPLAAISPEMLLDYVEQTPIYKIEEHVRPQWACCGYGRIPFRFIARVENLPADIAQAVELGLFPSAAAASIPHSNRSKPVVEDQVKQQLKSRIEACYSKDFEVFGY